MTAKPSTPLKIWSQSGNNIDPGDSKYQDGWVVEIPPHEHMNFIQRDITQMLKHINEEGVPIWDNKTEYPTGAIVKGDNKRLYTAVQDSTNKNPTANPDFWIETVNGRGILWDSSILYQLGDVATEDGETYVALAIHTSRQPKDNPAYWNHIASSETFEAGTRMLFTQANPPKGWAKTNNTNRLLRLATTGGVIGGTDNPIKYTNTHVHSTRNHTLTIAEMPLHQHNFLAQQATSGFTKEGAPTSQKSEAATEATAGTGGNDYHNHGDTFTASTTYEPLYMDVIECQKL